MPWRDLFRGSRGQLTAGILLVEFLVAVEALVVVAIMPAARHELGGLQYYGLVFTGFSLAALVASPLGGRAADRRGAAGPFLGFMVVFAAGTLLCGLAPSIEALVLARILQGLGAGGAYTAALAAVTRTYPDSARARMLALLAGAWIVPGLLGPSYGALLASSVGWRWAFFSIIPLIVVALALAFPRLRTLPRSPTTDALPLRWPLQLAIGLAAVVTGASWPSLLSGPLILIGGALAVTSLLAILPAGSLRAKRGMPAAIVMTAILVLAFISTEYFIPLILTTVRGRSLTEAGIVVTIGTVSWSLGNWWQARVVDRLSTVTLVRAGALILTISIAGIMLMLTSAPLLISYLAWLLAGVGMGIAYPSAYIVIMRDAPAGGEGAAISSQQVAERLALAVGGGLGGGCIALALTLHAPLRAGLAGALGLAFVASLAALAIARRVTLPLAAESDARPGA